MKTILARTKKSIFQGVFARKMQGLLQCAYKGGKRAFFKT
jgi:hypothetical protein